MKTLRLFLLVLLVSCVALLVHAAAEALPDAAPKFDQKFFGEMKWRSIGPYGGDARAFATVPGEPQHLYLGDTG